LKGVVSDIVLPDNFEYLKFREKDDPDALPWDEIKKATITNWRSGYELATIQKLSEARLQSNTAFKMIKENTDWLAKQNDREYSLNFDKYQKEQKAIRATVKQIESLKKLDNEMDVTSLPQDATRFSYDKGKQDRFEYPRNHCLPHTPLRPFPRPNNNKKPPPISKIAKQKLTRCNLTLDKQHNK